MPDSKLTIRFDEELIAKQSLADLAVLCDFVERKIKDLINKATDEVPNAVEKVIPDTPEYNALVNYHTSLRKVLDFKLNALIYRPSMFDGL